MAIRQQERLSPIPHEAVFPQLTSPTQHQQVTKDPTKSRGPKWSTRRGGGQPGGGGQGGFRGGYRQGQYGGSGGRGGAWGGQGGRGDGSRGEAAPEPNQLMLKGKQAKYMLQGQTKRGGYGNRGGRGGARRRDYNDRNEHKEPSVKIKSAWEQVDQIDLPQFPKMSTSVPTAVDLMRCGELRHFDSTLDKVTSKTGKPLKLTAETSFVYAGTLEDPVIENLAQEKKGTVFATDETLSYLMIAARGGTPSTPWDLVFTRVGDVMFIDKRDDAAFEILTVNETFTDHISEKDDARVKAPYNSPEKLGLEATAIHQSFLLQALKSDEPVQTQSQKNPFDGGADGEAAHQPITYKYRSWNLGSHTLVARTEVHASIPNKTGPAGTPDKEANIYALNEFDAKLSGNVDWRLKLDQQRGAVMANELKNNALKIARWTCQSMISGVDVMKIGFVSRASPTDPTKHVVLGVSTMKPKDLALQINLNEKNMWGIVKTIIDMVMAKGPGKFVLWRDPAKPVVKLHKVPMATFDESDNESEESDDDARNAGNDDMDDLDE